MQILPGLLIVLFVSAVSIDQIKICTDNQYIGRKEQSEFNYPATKKIGHSEVK